MNRSFLYNITSSKNIQFRKELQDDYEAHFKFEKQFFTKESDIAADIKGNQLTVFAKTRREAEKVVDEIYKMIN